MDVVEIRITLFLYVFLRFQVTPRRGRDSNPRYALTYTPLAGARLQPLGHLSSAENPYSYWAYRARLYCRELLSLVLNGTFLSPFEGAILDLVGENWGKETALLTSLCIVLIICLPAWAARNSAPSLCPSLLI
jgi:hypothetical protein